MSRPTRPPRHTYIYINTKSRPIALDTLRTHVTTAHVTIHTSQYDAKATARAVATRASKALQNPVARGVVVHDEFLATTRAATTIRHRRARFYAQTKSIARCPRTPSADRARAARHDVDECEVRGKRPLTRRLSRARLASPCRVASSPGARARSGKKVGKEITRSRSRWRTSVVVVVVRARAENRRASRYGVEARGDRAKRVVPFYSTLMEFYLYIRVDGGHDGCHGFVLYRTMYAIL